MVSTDGDTRSNGRVSQAGNVVDGVGAEEGPEVVGQPVGVAGGGHRHHDRAAAAQRAEPGHHQGARGLGHGEDRGGTAEHGREAGLLAQQRGEVAEHHQEVLTLPGDFVTRARAGC